MHRFGLPFKIGGSFMEVKKAIVIDDSKAMRSMLKNMLKQLGYDVLQAGDGKEALDVLEKNPAVSLVLVDWNMPTMNGYDFVKAVRERPTYDKTLLMMVTAETNLGRVEEALNAGANEYIMKPFTKEVIQDKLQLLGISK